MKFPLRWLLRRQRCLKHILVTFCVMYMFVLLFIHGAVLGSLSLCVLLDMSCSITLEDLWGLMTANKLFPNYSNQSISSPLARLHLSSSNALHFFDVPKSKSSVVFGEITTSNRNSKYRLAPDFTFHISYGVNQVVLYEDYGPGCVFRIYLYPALPTDSNLLYKMTSQHLHNLSLSIQVDGNNFTYPLDELMSGSTAPFVWPLSTRHSKPSSGFGAYTPICYQDSIVISYVHDRPFIPNLMNHTVNCTLNELQCDTKIYSAISRHKYPFGVKMQAYRETADDIAEISHLAKLLSHPESYGPGSSERCILSCVQVCPGCQRVLYHTIHSTGVLAALKFRVFEEEERSDWMDILLSVYMDDSATPQIDRVPLGSLFGAAGSLHDHQGAAFGRRVMKCKYEAEYVNKPSRAMTGYLFLPMPFWTELLVVIERSAVSVGDPVICYQLSVVDNHYDVQNTGYLHIKKSYYGEDVGRWREVVDIKGGSGHIVGVGVEIDNLRALRNVPLSHRWSALQADPVIYIDGAPSVLGTGLEDYFSYAHGFTGAENTTYAFVGVHHAGQPPNQLEPLTWHCYRQHVLDPISFTQSLHFIMEGTDKHRHEEHANNLSYVEHHHRKKAGNTTFAHIAYYYFLPNPVSENRHCDIIHLGNLDSESEHKFQMNMNDFEISDNKFQLHNARYIGDSATSSTFSGSGRFFNSGSMFAFTMSLEGSSSIVLLRRTYHLRAWHWNSKAKVSLNNMNQSVWFIPMGTLDEDYSMGVDQVTFYIEQIRIDRIDNKSLFTVSIEVVTEWRDISYELCFV